MKKSFPWMCPKCRTSQVYLGTISYYIEIAWDNQRHMVHVPALQLPICKACGFRLFDLAAEEQINSVLRTKLGLLTPEQIRQRRVELGVSNLMLAAHVEATAAQVNRWEGGYEIQSRHFDNKLREALGL